MGSGLLSKEMLKALMERGERPEVPQHALVSRIGWRSPYFGALSLRAEGKLAKASPRILDVLAQLDDADLYPGVVDLMAATAVPQLAHRMHAWYAGQDKPLAESFDLDELETLDEMMTIEVEALQDLDLAAWAQAATGQAPRQARGESEFDTGVRALLKRAGYRVRPALRPTLVRPELLDNADFWRDPFVPDEGGGLRDRRTGLVWSGLTGASPLSWDQASRLEVGTDGNLWRLPSRAELATLVGSPGIASDVWLWTSEGSSYVEYAWAAKASGATREALKSWRFACWRVRALTCATVKLG